jgi:RHS repeat-associated protein
VRNQIQSLTPPGGTATGFGFLGADQNELVSVGTTTLQNNQLGLGARTQSGTTSYFTRDPDGALIGQRDGTTRRYFVPDALGSIVGLTDSAGAQTATYTYDPYGRTPTGTTTPDSFGFAGGYRTVDGLYHFGQRFYDLARWTQADPLDQAEDLMQGNRYVYWREPREYD